MHLISAGEKFRWLVDRVEIYQFSTGRGTLTRSARLLLVYAYLFLPRDELREREREYFMVVELGISSASLLERRKGIIGNEKGKEIQAIPGN